VCNFKTFPNIGSIFLHEKKKLDEHEESVLGKSSGREGIKIQNR
jgi:hypothetical protein